MRQVFARWALLTLALYPAVAGAEPITLKLAFFSSDRSTTYLAAVKPFVDAVNAEGKGSVEIVLYSGGVLGREIARQPQVVLDGDADIAFVAVSAIRRKDSRTILAAELPGYYSATREKAPWFTLRLIAQRALKGYDDFLVIGAYVTELLDDLIAETL